MTHYLEIEAIEACDAWKVVDRWWTSEPRMSLWLALRAPDGSTVTVSWRPATAEINGRWELHHPETTS